MCRSDQSNVDVMCPTASETLELLFLEDTEQLRLQWERNIANFIQKQRSFVGKLEAPYLLCYCPSKGSSFVTEKFALKHLRQHLAEEPVRLDLSLTLGTYEAFSDLEVRYTGGFASVAAAVQQTITPSTATRKHRIRSGS